ncbi:WW domain-binding protein 4 [Trichogramma pretiosum]|uniref:WW domain-binding protein 4 n=1 Tax=Trichogramma pretiosum TaxID=7493 RepID=UPI0006C9A5B8|nr:WW domain-binding protein 4 [Trichogramma pretiosum]
MADYWKSQARKHCDFCKCWIADNKPSIEFHENGKRHKENVAKRIKESHKIGMKQIKQQKKFEDNLQSMEKAAMAAYMKDLAANHTDMSAQAIMQQKSESRLSEKSFASTNPNQVPDASPEAHPRNVNIPKVTRPKYTAADVDPCDPFAAQKLAKIAARDAKAAKKEAAKAKSDAEGNKKNSKGKKDSKLGTGIAVRKVWYEVKSQGYSYYWNTETNETMWEPPLEGYMSLEEQAEEAKEQELQAELLKEIDEQEKIEKKDLFEEQRANALREKMKLIRKQNEQKQSDADVKEEIPYRRDYSVPEKPQPYGSWTVIKTVEQPTINWQLPKVEEPEAPVISCKDPPVVKREFKEKTVTHLSLDDSDDEKPVVSFKKRKISQKNVRKTTSID